MFKLIKFFLKLGTILNIFLFDISFLADKFIYLQYFNHQLNSNIPYLKNYLEVLKTSNGFIEFIIAPLALSLIWELSNINKVEPKGAEKRYLHRFHKVSLHQAI